jgi:dCMP deaminase
MSRPTKTDLYLSLAALVAARSTCSRLAVGCVVVSDDLSRVLSVGHNGNARGLRNDCDDASRAGGCGCVHAEQNALTRAPHEADRVVFTTLAPCVPCAKLIVNSGVREVVSAYPYRDAFLLEQSPHRTHLRFRHALIQEALYSSLPLPWRQLQHSRIAAELARQSDADPAVIATQFLNAGEVYPHCDLGGAHCALRGNYPQNYQYSLGRN